MANTFDDTQQKLLIIIPAYNEAENIERVDENGSHELIYLNAWFSVGCWEEFGGTATLLELV